jgi:hypothetical protein
MKKPKESEKKATTNSRKKKLVGPVSAYVAQEPIKVEIVTAENGERMTKLSFASPLPSPIIHSADKVFAQAFEHPENLVDPSWWLVIKPWLQNTPAEIEAFWDKFNSAEATQERMWCTSGDKTVTWQKERALIHMVHTTRKILSDEIEVPSPTGLFPFEVTLMCKMAEWVMDAVENDPGSLRKLHTLLKNPEAANDTTNRERTNRGVFEAFSRIVAAEQKLPSKKQVREGAYIASDDNGRRIAARAFDELGLSGLQKG